MGSLRIGSVVKIIDSKDAFSTQVGVVVYYDKKRDKILIRFGGEQQLYYTKDQLEEYR